MLMDLVETYLMDGMFDRQHKTQFARNFRHLYFKSESRIRKQAAERLASKSATPREVVALVCCDQAEIASIMLAFSPLLDEAELTTQILQGNMLHRRAIAQRPDLSGALISQLLCFGEAPVARQLMPYADHLPDLSQRLCDLATRDRSETVSDRGQKTMAEPTEKTDPAPEPGNPAPEGKTMPDCEIDLFAIDTPKSLYIDENEPKAQLVNVWQALDGQTGNHLSTEFHYPPSYPMPLTVAGSEESKPEMTGSESHGPVVTTPPAEIVDQETMAEMPDVAFEDLSDEELEARFASGDFEELVAGEQEKEPRRLSFRIGVDDEDNAPIPSLEPFSYGRANGSIVMQGQEDETIPLDADREAGTITNAPRPVMKPETSGIRDEAHGDKASGTTKATGAQITLTIRKRSQDAERHNTETKPQPPKASVTLASATEDDWESALADLAKEFDPAETVDLPAVETKSASLDLPSLAAKPEAEAAITIRRTSSEASSLSIEPITRDETASAQSADEETATLPVSDETGIQVPDTVTNPAPKPVPEPVAEQTDIFRHMEGSEMASPVPADEELIHEHAPFGFMPDMVSFEGLDLVEAEPDLPSVTELLLNQRATPEMELVEPEEVHFSDNSLSSAMVSPAPSPEHNVMMQVTEQLAREKQARRYVEQKVAASVNPVTHSVFADKKQPVDKTDEAVSDALSRPLNELPAFADHKLVDEKAFATLKASETQPSDTELAQEETDQGTDQGTGKVAPPAINLSRPLSRTALEGIKGGQEGVAAQFFAYDADSRLDLLQAMLAGALADQALLNQRPQQMDEDQVRALISARFSNDRLSLVEMLHELSGHRRMDLAELLQDQGGEALVVYLYHIGLDESRALSFVLHGPDAIAHDYTKVSQLMTLFDQLYPAAAERIVTQLFGSPGKSVARHVPIHDNGRETNAPRLRQGGVEQQESGTQPAVSFGRRQGNQ